MLAWWGARFLESQLYGVGTGDLLTAALAIAALAAVAAVACWLPRIERRASIPRSRSEMSSQQTIHV
jgi:cyanate permease